MNDQSAETRAAEAAEELAAEGAAVTARAVRERSGVRMTVAAEAARAWNQQEAEAEIVPEAPQVVATRFTAIWREAVTLARQEFAEARAGWQTRVDQADAERDALAGVVAQVEADRDETQHNLQRALEEATAAAGRQSEEITDQRSRADRAEARAEAVESERDRLVAERDRLLVERDELRDQLREHREQ